MEIFVSGDDDRLDFPVLEVQPLPLRGQLSPAMKRPDGVIARLFFSESFFTALPPGTKIHSMM